MGIYHQSLITYRRQGPRYQTLVPLHHYLRKIEGISSRGSRARMPTDPSPAAVHGLPKVGAVNEYGDDEGE